ncbi:hypothetical protein [Corynebacterium mayonis]|uniref:hypothetical protein n=1 Tax=Corynebacterium mayonis TaxID=3062461 RepID=UPI003140B1B2
MGASRNFTATLAPPRETKVEPRRPTRRVAPHIPHTPRSGRLGSQQVVSVRGRRVGATKADKRRFSTVTAICVPLLIGGIAIAMILSGLATNQSFAIQKLQSQERTLRNEVETLNRDVKSLQSMSELSKRAVAAGMVVPTQPGILASNGEGEVEEVRPANPEATVKVYDLNRQTHSSRPATSDRAATDELRRSLTPVPGSNVLGADNQLDNARARNLAGNLAPYAPNVPAAR